MSTERQIIAKLLGINVFLVGRDWFEELLPILNDGGINKYVVKIDNFFTVTIFRQPDRRILKLYHNYGDYGQRGSIIVEHIGFTDEEVDQWLYDIEHKIENKSIIQKVQQK